MDISAAIDEVAKMLIQKVSESKNVSLGFISLISSFYKDSLFELFKPIIINYYIFFGLNS